MYEICLFFFLNVSLNTIKSRTACQCASDYCGMPAVALVHEVQDELYPTGSCKHY